MPDEVGFLLDGVIFGVAMFLEEGVDEVVGRVRVVAVRRHLFLVDHIMHNNK